MKRLIENRRGKNLYGTDTRALCTCGGRGVHWQHAGQSSSRNWWMIHDRFPTEEAQKEERNRLFNIIDEMVKWKNINNEQVLEKARKEILKSTDGNPPPVLDPFCGGGSIPLEAQRLGLKAYASDLNPVAVLITKALIEIPPKFADRPPVRPSGQISTDWHEAQEGWQKTSGITANGCVMKQKCA